MKRTTRPYDGGMIVVAGEALIDLVVQPNGALAAVPGGGPFNTARTIARLGGEVAFLGVLSTDRFGARLRDALADDGVDLSMTATTNAPSTLAIAELDDRGGATYRFYTAGTSAPELTADAVTAVLATQPTAFHLGSLGLVLEPIASALAAGTAAIEGRTLVMLDPNCRPALIRDRMAWLDRIHTVLARTDIVKLSVDDLACLDPGIDPAAAARRLLDRGPAVVLLTDGPRDARVLTREAAFELPVPPVQVVDTIGAGDAFGGAFLAYWIERGLSRTDLPDVAALREAVIFAIDVAAATCQQAGADPPRRSQIPQRLGPSLG
jgi:fructokinase